MTVFHILIDNNAVVENVLQQFLHQRSIIADLCQTVTYSSCFKVIGKYACPYRVAHCLVVVETVKLCLLLAIGCWVDILKHCLVGWDEEAVVGIEGVEIYGVLVLINSPVDELHRLVDYGWVLNADECRW